MGSSGTGRLSDYPGRRGNGGGSGNQGGSSGKDRCKETIVEQLEEVARCQYFRDHGQVPRVGTQVHLVQQRRIAVETSAGEVVGYLPTKYNYLAACMASGFKYSGNAITASNAPIPAVLVEMSPA